MYICIYINIYIYRRANGIYIQKSCSIWTVCPCFLFYQPNIKRVKLILNLSVLPLLTYSVPQSGCKPSLRKTRQNSFLKKIQKILAFSYIFQIISSFYLECLPIVLKKSCCVILQTFPLSFCLFICLYDFHIFCFVFLLVCLFFLLFSYLSVTFFLWTVFP